MEVLQEYLLPALSRIILEYNIYHIMTKTRHKDLYKRFTACALCEADKFEYPDEEFLARLLDSSYMNVVDESVSSFLKGFPYNITEVYYYFYHDYIGRKPTDEWVTMIVKIQHLSESQLEYWNSVEFDNISDNEKRELFQAHPGENNSKILLLQHRGTYWNGYGTVFTRYYLHDSIDDLLEAHGLDSVGREEKSTLRDLFYEFQYNL